MQAKITHTITFVTMACTLLIFQGCSSPTGNTSLKEVSSITPDNNQTQNQESPTSDNQVIPMPEPVTEISPPVTPPASNSETVISEVNLSAPVITDTQTEKTEPAQPLPSTVESPEVETADQETSVETDVTDPVNEETTSDPYKFIVSEIPLWNNSYCIQDPFETSEDKIIFVTYANIEEHIRNHIGYYYCQNYACSEDESQRPDSYDSLTDHEKAQMDQIVIGTQLDCARGFALHRQNKEEELIGDLRGTGVLVLDIDGDGIETNENLEAIPTFADADPEKKITVWSSIDDGILFMDRNGDGVIQRADFFGVPDFTGRDGAGENGFEDLALLDKNGDGILNDSDRTEDKNPNGVADMSDLGIFIWRDVNANTLPDEGEVMSLTAVGVKEFRLAYRVTGDDAVLNLWAYIFDSSQLEAEIQRLDSMLWK